MDPPPPSRPSYRPTRIDRATTMIVVISMRFPPLGAGGVGQAVRVRESRTVPSSGSEEVRFHGILARAAAMAQELLAAE